MALDIAMLEDSLDRWSFTGYCATGLVAVGCIGESIVEFTNWVKSNWLARSGMISALVLIFGVAAEVVTQVKVNSISGQIIAALNNDTASLRLELAKIRLPRALSPVAQKRVASKIAMFKGQAYSLAEGPIEPESKIDAELIKALDLAGWQLLPVPDRVLPSRDSRVIFSLSDQFGVVVQIDQSETDKVKQGEALAAAIRDEEIAASTGPLNDRQHKAGSLAILIAPKP